MNTVTSQDGTRIAYERTGDGPAVILVGGGLCDRHARASGTPLAALLAPQFTVYSYDRRGRGDSGDTMPYAVEREVEDIAALIKEAGGSAHLYGMSSGAVLALYAAAHGLSVTRLVAYEPPFRVAGDDPSSLPDGYRERLHSLIGAGQRGDALEHFMTQAVGVPAEVVGQMRRAPMWLDLEKIAHTLAYDDDVVGDGSVPAQRLAAIGVPTLVLAGGDSPRWFHNGAQATAAALPQGRYQCLEGATHDVAPEMLSPALAEFYLG